MHDNMSTALIHNLSVLNGLLESPGFSLKRYGYLDNLFDGFTLYIPENSVELVSSGLLLSLGIPLLQNPLTPEAIEKHVTQKTIEEWTDKMVAMVSGGVKLSEGIKELVSGTGQILRYKCRATKTEQGILTVYEKL